MKTLVSIQGLMAALAASSDSRLVGARPADRKTGRPAPAVEIQGPADEQRGAEHGLLPDAHRAAIASRVHAEMVSTLLSDLVLQVCERAA